jgi:hypothetical protein
VTYNTPVYETSTQSFVLNVSMDSGENVAVTLIYNGTPYSTSLSQNGDTRVYTSSLNVPTITDSTENKSFYWTIVGSVNSNTTTYVQTVNKIFLNTTTGCNYLVANFTDYDEETLVRINPFLFRATFNYWLGDGSIKGTAIVNNISINELNLCFDVANTTLYSEAIIEYGDSNVQYVTRNYYYINASFNSNASQNVDLYSLNLSSSTSFILQVYAPDSTPDPNVFINTMRYYPGEDKWRLVQMAKTSDAGISVGYFKTEIPDYKFILVKDGVVVLSTSSQKVVPQTAPYTITFYLGNNPGEAWLPFQNQSNFQYSLTYNDTTKMVYYDYIDTSGSLSYVKLLVTQNNYTGQSRTVCNVSSVAVAGVISCNVTGYSGDMTARAYLSRSPEWLVSLIAFTINGIQQYSGLIGPLIGWLILICCVFIMIPNPTAGIVLINVALWFDNLLGLLNLGWPLICGISFISIILIWEMNT